MSIMDEADQTRSFKKSYAIFGAILFGAYIMLGFVKTYFGIGAAMTIISNMMPMLAGMVIIDRLLKNTHKTLTKAEKERLLGGCFWVFISLNIVLTLISLAAGVWGGFSSLILIGALIFSIALTAILSGACLYYAIYKYHDKRAQKLGLASPIEPTEQNILS